MTKRCYRLIAALTLLLATAGCQDEVPNAKPTPTPATLSYTLYTDVPPLTTPTTRIGSADEDGMAAGQFWVLVFDNTGTPADSSSIKLLEVVRAEATTSTAPGPYKWVTQLQSRSHAVKVVLLANAPALVYNSSGTTSVAIDPLSFPADMTYAEALEKLYTAPLTAGASVSYVPYTPDSPPSGAAKPIPLCAVKNFSQLDVSTNLGTEAAPLRLSRLVAKITVENQTPAAENGNALKPDFRIVGVNLHNAPRNSNLVLQATVSAATEALIKYEGTSATYYTTAIAPPNDATGRSTANHPIYLYESNETDPDKQPFALLEATYNGTTCYYKLSAITPHTPQIKRNTHYRFLIQEAVAPGYTTYSEALSAPTSNNIRWRMEVTDLTGHDILDNGQYYIAVSNSEYVLFSSLHPSGIEAVTVSHNLPPSIAPPTVELLNDGATFTPGQAGLTLATPTTARFANANTGAGQQQSILLDFNNLYVPNSAVRLLIRAGNLSKEIVVRRQSSAPFTGGALTYFANPKEYVVGEITTTPLPDWAGLSSGTTFWNTAYLAGQGVMAINVVLKENPDVLVDREIEAYFSRSDNRGRVKAHIVQEGATP